MPPVIPDEDLDATRREWLATGGVVSEAARRLGVPRQTMQHRLRVLADKGMIEYDPAPNLSASRTFGEMIDARLERFHRRSAKGNWRKLSIVNLRSADPFVLVILGDPHWDDDACDHAEFLRWTLGHEGLGYAPVLSRADGVYGLCVGDYLNNWVGRLQRLYAHQEGTADEAWDLLVEYVTRMRLLASCSGNHDDWSDPTPMLKHVMREAGTLHRAGAIRVGLAVPGRARPITVAMRHKWKGNSQWNDLHAITKAAQMGQRDHVMVGGHKHVSGHTTVAALEGVEGSIASCCIQVGAFKTFDTFADTEGFLLKRPQPAYAVVVDPRRADDDPGMCMVFADPHDAIRYRDSIR